MKYKPPSIQEIGLKEYLSRTSNQHMHFGYDAFVAMVEQDVNPTNIARAFNVDRRTVVKWLEVYKKENHATT